MNLLREFNYPLVLLFFMLLYACSSDDESPIDCSASSLQAAAGNIVDASCGLDNGNFELTISGGVAPFEFSVAGSGFQAIGTGTSTVDGVASGNQAVTIRDGQGCTAMVNVNIADVNNLALDTQLEAAGCETSNGTITVNANGGKEPYSYSLDGGAAQAENVFDGLAVGDYTALVTDDDGCETSVTVSVLSGVSYNDQITPIIDTNCAKSNCHDGSNAAIPDWTDLATVQANAANIVTRTANGSMPPAGNDPLQPEQIQAIACWVDDGALDN